MTPRKLSGLVLVAVYAAISLICAFAPDLISAGSVLSATMVGPPLLLIWGGDVWQAYLLLTLTLAALASVVLFCRTPEAKVVAAFAGAFIWFGGGFFALALSV